MLQFRSGKPEIGFLNNGHCSEPPFFSLVFMFSAGNLLYFSSFLMMSMVLPKLPNLTLVGERALPYVTLPQHIAPNANLRVTMATAGWN